MMPSDVACPYCKGVGEHACNCFDPVPRTWKDIHPALVTVFAADHAKLVSDVSRLTANLAAAHVRIADLEKDRAAWRNTAQIEIGLRADEQAEIARLKKANVHDCMNVQTVIDGRLDAEADNTRLRQRIAEVEGAFRQEHERHLAAVRGNESARERIAELEAALATIEKGSTGHVNSWQREVARLALRHDTEGGTGGTAGGPNTYASTVDLIRRLREPPHFAAKCLEAADRISELEARITELEDERDRLIGEKNAMLLGRA